MGQNRMMLTAAATAGGRRRWQHGLATVPFRCLHSCCVMLSVTARRHRSTRTLERLPPHTTPPHMAIRWCAQHGCGLQECALHAHSHAVLHRRELKQHMLALGAGGGALVPAQLPQGTCTCGCGAELVPLQPARGLHTPGVQQGGCCAAATGTVLGGSVGLWCLHCLLSWCGLGQAMERIWRYAPGLWL